MALSLSSDADSSSASQEIIRTLWNLNVHCRIHNNPPLVPILSQINLFYTPSCFFKIHFNDVTPSTLRYPKPPLSLGIPTNIAHTHTHTHIYIYVYIYMHFSPRTDTRLSHTCFCSCLWRYILESVFPKYRVIEKDGRDLKPLYLKRY